MVRVKKKSNGKETPVLLPDIIINTTSHSKKKKKEIHKIVKDTNHTAHSILDVVEDTHMIANSANDKVYEQGEQVDRIGNVVADTHLTVKESKSKVKGIHSFFSAMKNFLHLNACKHKKKRLMIWLSMKSKHKEIRIQSVKKIAERVVKGVVILRHKVQL